MSQYTTDEVLEMMESWNREHRQSFGFMPRFTGFDGLQGADLRGIDLSRDMIETKANQYGQRNESEPPWLHRFLDAIGLDLRGALLSTAEQPTDFARAQLQGAYLNGSQLSGAILWETQLEGASLSGAQLQKAELWGVKLHGARLWGANLQRAHLWGVDLKEARLEDVRWGGDYVVGEEADGEFTQAESIYRDLQQYYSGTGQYEHAGEFHIRKLLMRRKTLLNLPGLLYPVVAVPVAIFSLAFLPLQLLPASIRNPEPWTFDLRALLKFWMFGRWEKLPDQREALVLFVSAVVMGHGERPSWVVGWVVACFAAFAMAYWLLDALPGMPLMENIRYSADVMTSFGKREGVAQWAQDAGLVQSFISYVLLALFLVTFVRKVSPR